jgi:hypothetical protein
MHCFFLSRGGRRVMHASIFIYLPGGRGGGAHGERAAARAERIGEWRRRGNRSSASTDTPARSGPVRSRPGVPGLTGPARFDRFDRFDRFRRGRRLRRKAARGRSPAHARGPPRPPLEPLEPFPPPPPPPHPPPRSQRHRQRRRRRRRPAGRRAARPQLARRAGRAAPGPAPQALSARSAGGPAAGSRDAPAGISGPPRGGHVWARRGAGGRARAHRRERQQRAHEHLGGE